MAKFVELPHGYGVDIEEILYYRICEDVDDYDYNELEPRPQRDIDMAPLKLFIHFKNGDDLEIPSFERKFMKDFWNALNMYNPEAATPDEGNNDG